MEHPKQLNPVSLAFLGDSIYEAMVRSYVVEKHQSLPPGKLHKICVQFVKAEAQYKALQAIDEMLTEEEQAIVRRGRNYSGVTAPKNADVHTYRYATGFEALFGYLYLKGQTDRLKAFFEVIKQLGFDHYHENV